MLLKPPIPYQQETYNPVPNEIINWIIKVLNGNVSGFASEWSDVGVEFVIDGGGAQIASGVAGDLEVPFNCVINRATLLANQVGSIVVDVWKAPLSGFPPTVANSITGGTPPTLAGANDYQDSTLAGWTTQINAGDILRFNASGVVGIQRVTLSLKVMKN